MDKYSNHETRKRCTNGAINHNMWDSASLGLTLNVKQIAEVLKVSTRTINRLRNKGDFPEPRKVGKLSRWATADVGDWWALRAAQ